MKHDPHAYTITIQKVRIDGDDYFESTIKELPDAAMYGETYQEAYELAIDTIETTAVMLEEAGREMPNPMFKHEDFSGRVTLRMAKSLHEKVTTYAEHEGVSLNSYITTILAENVGSVLIMDSFQIKVNDMLSNLITNLSQPNKILLSQEHIFEKIVTTSSDKKNICLQ